MSTPNTLRVLHVINTCSVGGAERHLLDVVRGQRARGLDVALAFFKEEAQEARSLVDDFRATGAPVFDLRARAAFDPLPAVRLWRVVRRLRPDVVHTHLYRADIFGTLVARLQKVAAVVSSVHNNNLPERYYRRPVTMAYRHVDRVIAISESVKVVLEGLGVPSTRIRVVPYGLDLAGWDATGPRGTANPVVGTIARLNRVKNLDVLVDAFARVQRELPDARLVIAGHDDGNLRPALEAQIARLGLGGAATLTGYVDDARRTLAGFDVFALASANEGFGLSVLEAMASGLPVVATRVGNLAALIADGTTGVLVPPGDVAALADALLTVLRDRERARVMGQAGRQRAETEFGLEVMLDRISAVYDELVPRGGSGVDRGAHGAQPLDRP